MTTFLVDRVMFFTQVDYGFFFQNNLVLCFVAWLDEQSSFFALTLAKIDLHKANADGDKTDQLAEDTAWS